MCNVLFLMIIIYFEPDNSRPYSGENPFLASIISNNRVTATEHFQETRLIKFDISEADHGLEYKPGDVVMIKPSNTDENVKRFLGFKLCFLLYAYVLVLALLSLLHCLSETLSHLNTEESMNILSEDRDSIVPTSLSKVKNVRQLAKSYFDFMSVPRYNYYLF